MGVKDAAGEGPKENERAWQKESIFSQRINILQKVGRNINGKGTAGECSEGNKDHVTETERREILVT